MSHADAIHTEIAEALGIPNAHGSKSAAARALGLNSPQVYSDALKTGATTALQARLLAMGFRIVIDPGPRWTVIAP